MPTLGDEAKLKAIGKRYVIVQNPTSVGVVIYLDDGFGSTIALNRPTRSEAIEAAVLAAAAGEMGKGTQ